MTDRQIGNIIDDMIVLVDTREKSNKHIIDWLKENNIKYEIEKLDSCDYSFKLVGEYSHLSKSVLVERKNSLDELAGNFSINRSRFEREFERIPANTSVHLVVENFTWTKLFNKSYRSGFSSNSYMASIFSFSTRYDFKVWTCRRDESPIIMYNIMKYELRNKLKSL